jgi:hypothetical protein
MNREAPALSAGAPHLPLRALAFRGWESRSKLHEGAAILTFQFDARSYMSLKTRFRVVVSIRLSEISDLFESRPRTGHIETRPSLRQGSRDFTRFASGGA